MEQNCPTCNASLKKFWHRLSPGLIKSLIKFRRAVHEKNSNNLHLYNDLTGTNQLTTAEQMNWTKLRFHGLVAKAKEEKHWLITYRGAQFLNGEIQIPKRVQTFRNQVIAKDDELITINEVIGELPVFDSKDDMKFDYASETDMEKVAVVRPKKKTLNSCFKCGTEMKIDFKIKSTEGNSVKAEKILKCPKCGEETFYL